MTCETVRNPTDFDLRALRLRYDQERDRRIREDGEAQYVEVAADYADYYETDPWSPPVDREPISEDIDVAVLGGGFAGLMAGAHFRQDGIDSFRIIEMGGDFGGAWYWNRYPGVQCDTESYCYLPLLEELNYMPKEKYAYGVEIYEHCQRIGQHFSLYEKALFGTIVRSVRWDEELQRWCITTDRGDDIRARFMIMSSGPYNRPKLPGIKGLDRFRGHTFHTSRWDFDYTGGDTNGGLTKLADKKVAVIGTGATGSQCIPHIGRDAGHLYVFQRTPSAVDVRNNKLTDPAWANSLKPGWQRERQANFHAATFDGFPAGMEDLVCDGWTEINRNLSAKWAALPEAERTPEKRLELLELEDYGYQERVRRRVHAFVRDDAVADKLKAYYRFLCKRPTFHDEYLQTFDRDNVTLIDVAATQGVEEVTEKGIIAGGVEYEVDCIIFASGFEVTTSMKRRVGIDTLEGRDGLSLYDHWQDGFKTLHGFTTRGFPNMFFPGFVQGGVTVNVTHMYDKQTEHIAYMIRQALDREAGTIEPSAEAQSAWVKTMRDTEVSNKAFLMACTPGYYNNEGGKTMRSHLGEVYGPGFAAFTRLIRDWRDEGNLQGMVFEPRKETVPA